MFLMAWKKEDIHGVNCGQTLGAESEPQLTASKEMETQSHNQEELISANSKNELGNKYVSRAYR